MLIRLLFKVAALLCVGLPFASSVYAQAPRIPQSKFKIEIHSDDNGQPQFTVTNLTQKTLTACVIEFSRISEMKSQSRMTWDPIIQFGPVGHPEMQQHPLQPGASMTQFLGHVVGEPPPDTIEIVAGIWADGETFGDSEKLRVIQDQRARFVSGYEAAISLLQKGLNENWTGDQYLAALNGNSNFALHGIRSTLQVNAPNRNNPRMVRLIVERQLAYLEQNLARIREAKPAQ